MHKNTKILISLVVVIAICASMYVIAFHNVRDVQTNINGIAVPPEPDPELNNATLAGIDVNGNGVRDDVERLIAMEFGDSPTKHEDATKFAATQQQMLIEGTEEATLLNSKAFQCSSLTSEDTNPITYLWANTEERVARYKNVLVGAPIRKQECAEIISETPVKQSGSSNEVEETAVKQFEAETGIAVKSPGDWYAYHITNESIYRLDLQNVETLGPPGSPDALFRITRHHNRNPDPLPIEQWFSKPESNYDFTISSRTLVTVSGEKGMRITRSELGGDIAVIYIPIQNDLITISYAIWEPRFIPTYESILDSIVIKETEERTSEQSTSAMETINGIAVPPEPDPELNNATLAGIDVNENGVRDDVERLIAREFGSNESQYLEVMSFARAEQKTITEPSNEATAAYAREIECSTISLSKVTFALTNTPERVTAFRNANAGMSLTVGRNCE